MKNKYYKGTKDSSLLSGKIWICNMALQLCLHCTLQKRKYYVRIALGKFTIKYRTVLNRAAQFCVCYTADQIYLFGCAVTLWSNNSECLFPLNKNGAQQKCEDAAFLRYWIFWSVNRLSKQIANQICTPAVPQKEFVSLRLKFRVWGLRATSNPPSLQFYHRALCGLDWHPQSE